MLACLLACLLENTRPNILMATPFLNNFSEILPCLSTINLSYCTIVSQKSRSRSKHFCYGYLASVILIGSDYPNSLVYFDFYYLQQICHRHICLHAKAKILSADYYHAQSFQEISLTEFLRCDNFYIIKFLQNQKVLISADDIKCFCILCAAQKFIIIRIPA